MDWLLSRSAIVRATRRILSWPARTGQALERYRAGIARDIIQYAELAQLTTIHQRIGLHGSTAEAFALPLSCSEYISAHLFAAGAGVPADSS